MGYFDYSREPKSDIAFVDMKSILLSIDPFDIGLVVANHCINRPVIVKSCLSNQSY